MAHLLSLYCIVINKIRINNSWINILFFCFAFLCKAQKVEWNITYNSKWFNTNQNMYYATTKGIDCDSSGDIYSIKVFMDSTYGEYISKHSPQGQLLWTKRCVGILDKIKSDQEGNVYLIGRFYQTANIFGINLTDTAEYYVGFYAKLNSNGICQWAYKLPHRVGFRDIEIASSEEIYIVGDVSLMNATVGNDLILSGHNFISKIKPDGSIQWAKPIAMSTFCKFLRKDNYGNYIIAGQLTGSAFVGKDINPLYLNGHSPGDIFIAKLDSNFNAVWAKLGSSYGGNLNGLELDNSGNAYIAGTLGYYLVFGGQYIQTSGSNMFLLKVNANGNLLWIKNSELLNPNIIALNECYGLTVDQVGNSYVTGGINNDTTQFDSFVITKLGSPYVFKYDTDGNLLWGLNREIIQADQDVVPISYAGAGKAICNDKDGNILIAGYCGAYENKSFITKVSDEKTIGINEFKTNELFTFNVYPNPTAAVFQINCSIFEKCKFQIIVTDLKGQKVYTESISQFQGEYNKTIDLSKHAKGIYFIEIITDGKRAVKRIAVH